MGPDDQRGGCKALPPPQGRVSWKGLKQSFTEAKEKITQRREVTYDFWVVPMAEAEAALKTHTDLNTHVLTAEKMNLLQQPVVDT